nr:hypothetical protein [Tanacetum cinerariifolium]
ESAEFEHIIDLLKSKPIHYALTVNPTIYVSCVKQFWATTKVKRVNDQEQIQALVDMKTVIITKDNIRSELLFDDAEGIACLPNEAIFEGLACMGAKTTAWNEFSSTMAFALICLADNQKFNFSKYIFKNMVKSIEGGIKFYLFLRFLYIFLDKQVEGMARHKEMYIISSHTKKIFANIKRIEERFSRKKQTPRRKHMKEAEVSHDKSEDEDHVPTPSSDLLPSGKRVKSPLEKDSLGAQEDASKQGRMIEEIDQDDEIALDVDTQRRKNDDEMFGVDDISREKVVLDTPTVTTIADKVSVAPTTDVTKYEITMAQALAALKSIKLKVVVQEQEQSHIPTVSSLEDKGKAKMIEPKVPIKKKDQMRMDEVLQAKEREEFSEVQKARLLVELIEKRKKHFAALRAQEKRNKPPTKAQMRRSKKYGWIQTLPLKWKEL